VVKKNYKKRKAALSTFIRKRCLSNVADIDTRGRFHQHMLTAFFCTNMMTHLMANGSWQMSHRFGKWHTNLANGTHTIQLVSEDFDIAQFLVILNGVFFRHFTWCRVL